MGNKLIVRIRNVLERNQSGGDRKSKSITAATEAKFIHPSIETEGHNSVVDNLGNFTRSASGSVRSSKILGNTVSFSRAFHYFLMYKAISVYNGSEAHDKISFDRLKRLA